MYFQCTTNTKKHETIKTRPKNIIYLDPLIFIFYDHPVRKVVFSTTTKTFLPVLPDDAGFLLVLFG
jgi:hypothetical protein